MSAVNINPRTTVLVSMILLAAAFRLVQSSPVFSILSNLTPFGAMALFGGYYFRDKWKAMLVPVIALWLSDIFLNRFYYKTEWVFFYSGQLWVYGVFAATVLLGMMIGRPSFLRVTGFGVGAALLHWLVTDFGVWIGGATDITTGLPFTKDWNGFVKCLTLAIPFLRNMILGNLVFCGVMFGAFEWAQRKYPALKVG
ncbi:MAG: hypothetical protein JNN04_01285 [Cyclobacteriaceae bacterium]|nr:hypothetical protein [Cyclobacteriaceae bacterium]